jgi:uncharacterized DUF497 family protein
VEIEFDGAKDANNLLKHGINLVRAADLTDVIEIVDNRREYGETRFIAVGLIDQRVHVCVYTPRRERRRIISLRKANRREIDAYHQARQGGY